MRETRSPTSRPAVRSLGVAALIALALSSPLSSADDGPHDKAIEARQAMFRLYGWNFGTLSAMAKEKAPYDAERAAAAAANLDALANLDQDGFWPPGSDNETEGNATTRALPAIWETFPEIVEKADALKASTATLKGTAGEGLDALRGAIGDVGGSCKGCHDDYRAERR